MYKFYYKKELLETVECKQQANELLAELNIMYKSGVIMKYEKEVEVLTCYCGDEIETGDFCSKECYSHYFNEIT